MSELKLEFLGVSGVNNFVGGVSSPRAVMDFSHFAAHIAIHNPDEKIIKSGIEYELGKNISDVRTDRDCTVKHIVTRYREYGEMAPASSVFVEYEEDGQVCLDIIEVPYHRSNHTFFGYPLRPTEALKEAAFGSALPAGTVLAAAESLGRDGSYNFGLNANVAFMSHPSASEDGFVVSESFAKRASFPTLVKRVININRNTIPLNLFGDDDRYQILPYIGQKVRSDGLLCALRPRNDWFSICDTGKTLSRFDNYFDDPTYVAPDAVVVDVQVVRGNSRAEFTPQMTAQLDEMAEALLHYHRQMVAKFEALMQEKKSLHGTLDCVRLSPRMNRIISDSMTRLHIAGSRKVAISHRKLPIDQYRIEVTVMKTMVSNYGGKLTDLHGAKGVICLILPDDQMPVDQNGVRADVITDSASIVSRMNPSRAYEGYLGAMSRDNQNRLRAYAQQEAGHCDVYQFTPAVLEAIKEKLLNIHNSLNHHGARFISMLDDKGLRDYIHEVLHHQLNLFYPPDNELSAVEVQSAIELTDHRPHRGPLTYVNALGERVTTREDFIISRLYMIVLEKIGATYSAVASAKVNNFGLPVKGSNIDKQRSQHSHTPGRINSETDNRILLANMGPHAIAEMMDLAQNPVAHKALYRDIIRSKSVYRCDQPLDRTNLPYNQTKGLQTFNHIFAAAGCAMVFDPETTPTDVVSTQPDSE